jgi:hypothetical protein|tara:strand:+ start:102 stop:590 length:489 start_codon:yes stop_codon:yes gene_type:complete
MAKKPLSALTKDLRKFVEDGRAAAGPIVVRSLQIEGPWWTGNFGRRWKLRNAPVMPVHYKDGLNRGWPGNQTNRFYRPVPELRLSIGQTLYIGNSVSYAGFAVNNPNATVTRPDGTKTTYENHAMRARITPPSKNPDWYKVYTASGGLFDDLTKAFRAAGAK